MIDVFLMFIESIIAGSLGEKVGCWLNELKCCGRFLAKGANQLPILGDLTNGGKTQSRLT